MSEEKSESEHLFNIIKERYGERLSNEELAEVKKGVDRLVEAAEKLREIRLENGDEPFFVFRPYRGEE
jgi:TATA-binding protein-associated factor Taf7